MTQTIIHRGFDCFRHGRFEGGGRNLYVNARGSIETIHRTDLNGDGLVDIIIPNAHGYIERGPTLIYKPDAKTDVAAWDRRELPNDSGWMSRVVDIDGDGYLDLIVVNAENGVTSELTSYVYWGGPSGLSGECTQLPTIGAYGVAVADINSDGRKEIIFPSAWVDHHNSGKPRPVQVYGLRANRHFENISDRFPFYGVAGASVAVEDLTGNGKPDLVIANYYESYNLETDSFVFLADSSGRFSDQPLRLPTRGAAQVEIADLNGDGFSEVVFAGGDQVIIYWNRHGKLDPCDRTVLPVKGVRTAFRRGAVQVAVADVDCDGHAELLVAMADGIEIRKQENLHRVAQLLTLPWASWVEAADLNGDGRLEIIASKYSSDASYNVDSAIFWNGPEGLSDHRVSHIPTRGAVGCTSGDLDGDGKPVVIFNSTMQGPAHRWKEFPFYIYQSSRQGDYSTDHRLELPTGGEASGYIVADLNDNGYPDIVIAELFMLRVFTNNGDGFKSDRYIDLPINAPGGFLMQVHVADFNGDGYLDLLAMVHTYDDKPDTMSNSSRIFWGSDKGFDPDNYTIVPTYCSGLACLAGLGHDGNLDLITTDKRGCLAIYHGESDYRYEERTVIELGVTCLSHVNAADLTSNGYLDLIVGVSGHYERSTDITLIILYGGPEGYSMKRSYSYHGGFTPGHATVTDLNNNGCLDLLVPAYSTDKTRTLDSLIFRGRHDGMRTYIDFDNPDTIQANAGFHFLPFDLNGNGYNDLIFACHRDNIAHAVDSKIYWNGPEGLSEDRVTLLPGLGPHFLRIHDPGNLYDRRPYEIYVSSPIELQNRQPGKLHWTAEVPHRTQLKFQLRYANSIEELEQAVWQGPQGPESYYDTSAEPIATEHRPWQYMQYHAIFICPCDINSPKLSEVRIEMG